MAKAFTILCYFSTILSLHFVIKPCLAVSSISTDMSALLVLKSSISGDPGNVIARNWSSSAHVCSWMGVTCSSRHERVTALDISDMNLEGTIPPKLGNLSFLISLDASNNSFYGTLPHELANLKRIRLIDLRSNNLSGIIPPIFSSLPDLRFLYLSRNTFSGPIPISITECTKLEELGLSRNSLEGEIPEEIGNLRNLTFLNFEGNSLTGLIPLSIFNLSSLQWLALTRNDLTGKLPVDICDNLPMLHGLYLSSNWFDGMIPSGLQNCAQLQVLSLSGNEFTGSIPKELGNLTMLTVLHLGANNLEGQIPAEIGNLQNLEVFGLNRNPLSGSIPASIFNMSALQLFTSVGTNLSGSLPPNFGLGTPNLQELYLGMNNLSGIIPASVSNATMITVLDLSNNSFTGPIPESLGDLEFLRLLNLGGNKLTNPPSSAELTFLTSLTKCRRLRELVIGENPLGGKLPASIGDFSSSLEIFAAYRCRIHGYIPEEIGKLNGVAMLSLFDNELTGNIPLTIVGLEKLQQLYLRNNKITGSIPDNICGLKDLGALDLSNNQLSGVLPACIGKLTSLRNLYVAFNNLSSTLPDGIWNLNNLLKFNASSNILEGRLPNEIGNLKDVHLLDLSFNNLSGDIPITISGLESLIDLSLAYNNFNGSIPDSLGKVLSLEGLDLSHNNLTGAVPKSLEALSYLSYLNVSFNRLSGEIPNGGPFVNFSYESFMSNEALCGNSRLQVPACRYSSPKNSPRKKKTLHVALFSTFGGMLAIVSLVALILLRFRSRKKDSDQTDIIPQVSHERISYDELQKATNNFNESNLLGTGGYSSVYKGILDDEDTPVAVKVFNLQLEGAFKSFNTECEVLRSLRHRNLTKVISSCSNLDFRALVLEYMPNGSLEKWLYSHNYFLNIIQRLNIAIDVACALDYLHNACVVPVLHCDLKPSNVLLDKELVAHVSDFGISKILGDGENTAQTKTMATIGYIAPEYGREGLVSTKSDVYSYGILLMETFTRVKPSDDAFVGELSLKQWVKDSVSGGDITRVVDSNLLTHDEEDYVHGKLRCLSSIMEVAVNCTEESPDARIGMKDAVVELVKIKNQFFTICKRSL